jgi:hypothetical protein
MHADFERGKLYIEYTHYEDVLIALPVIIR